MLESDQSSKQVGVEQTNVSTNKTTDHSDQIRVENK